MDELTPVSTTYLKHTSTEPSSGDPSSRKQHPGTIAAPQDAYETLRSQPDYDQLISVLRYLQTPTADFNIWTASSESGRMVSVLVEDIAKNYWAVLVENQNHGQDHVQLFLSCLLSIAGLNALVTQLRMLSEEADGRKGPVRPTVYSAIDIYLELLSSLLQPHDALSTLWAKVSDEGRASEHVKTQLLREFHSLLIGSKVLNAAQALAAGPAHHKHERPQWWITDNHQYSTWLGRNLASWARLGADQMKVAGHTWSRALRMGFHGDEPTAAIIDSLLLARSVPATIFSDFLRVLPARDQKAVIEGVISLLSRRFLSHLPRDHVTPDPAIAGVAGLLKRVVDQDAGRRASLVKWLSGHGGAGFEEDFATRRAVVGVVAENQDDVLKVVEDALAVFGDKLYIDHAPTSQQEARAQSILLAAGRLHRLAPLKLVALVKTGGYLGTISNRLATPRAKSRFLGMVIGEALSSLVDDEQKRLKFGLEELETEEAAWLKGLVSVYDVPGDFDALLIDDEAASANSSAPGPAPPRTPIKPAKAQKSPIIAPKPKTKPLIQVVDSDASEPENENADEDDDDDDDLKPYAKPSVDPQDEDEDPTLITRSRPQPPVYVRTLLAYLGASNDLDKQTLALRHGPRLIRSKSSHGTEVSEHAVQLASKYVGMADSFGIERFLDMRLRCLVALVVAVPEEMAPWMARALWEGDLSVTQRTSLLLALGLGGREVAGLQKPDAGENVTWVGERLPEKLERLYQDNKPSETVDRGKTLKPLSRNAIDTAAQDITTTFLVPVAAKVADETAGPDVLKLSSFKSRLDKAKVVAPRVRAIPNTTSALICTSFFTPLHARLAYSLSRRHPVMHLPHVLVTYVKTLGLLVHAAGSSTLALPQMTSELWDLLLALRSKAFGQLGVAAAILGALVALLEVNDVSGPGGRIICANYGRQAVETKEWAAVVFGQASGDAGADAEEREVKMLAAGVLLRLDEMLDKHRMLLLGM